MLTIRYRRAAQLEYNEAAKWYESTRPGLGARFLQVVDDFIDGIATDPERYPIVVEDIRQAFVGAFPYCVYYRIIVDRIQIIAIVHTSRDSAVWQARI